MNKTVQDLDSYSYDEIIKIINDFIMDKIWDNGY